MKKNKLTILLVLLLVSICIFLTTFYILEPDYFWHIKAGEYMFKNGVLTHDIFSWVVNGKYWMSHEWLFEVILYCFKLVFGKFHTLVYCFVSLLILMSIIFYYNRKKLTKNIPYTLLYLTLFVTTSLLFIQARPHMLSYSFIALTIALLYDLYKNENSKKVYFIPLISILWANYHGGSSNLSYIFTLMFLFSGLFNIKLKKIEIKKLTKKQIIKYLLIAVLCAIGICINIHGFKMFIYPYENILDTTMISNINEWQSTSFTNLYNYVYIIFLLVIIILMVFNNKKIKLIDILLLVATIVLGIKSLRFWLYCPIVMSFSIFDYFDERKVGKKTNIFISIIIVLLIGSSIFIGFNKFKNFKYEIYIDNKTLKVLEKENPKRLFNMYDYGGELVYHNIPVFIDGRADLYSKYNLQDAFDIMTAYYTYPDLIRKYDFDYMLLKKDGTFKLQFYLKYNKLYEVIYENDELMLYKKTVK